MTGQTFISHDPTEAAAYVDGLNRYLTSAGLTPWYEREIGGDHRWAQVVEQLRGCSAVVVVMTPGAERSPWVAAQLAFAKDLGKPILPLLLGGTPFAILTGVPYETVTTGAMPSAAFITRLRSFGPVPVAPATPVAVAGPGPAPYQPPTPPAQKRGLFIGIIAAAVVVVLVAVCVGGFFVLRTGGVDGLASDRTKPWPERAAAIPGIHNYLVTNPEWFVIPPEGNHRRGLISYPISPPVGGLHNPVWQNCMGDVYDAEIPREQAMHSLEHGAVWVTYRPDLSKSDIDKLASKVRGVPYTLMSPYPGLDVPISLQAWGYQLKLDNAGDSRIDTFLEVLRQNASQEPMATCSNGITDTGAVPLDLQ